MGVARLNLRRRMCAHVHTETRHPVFPSTALHFTYWGEASHLKQEGLLMRPACFRLPLCIFLPRTGFTDGHHAHLAFTQMLGV